MKMVACYKDEGFCGRAHFKGASSRKKLVVVKVMNYLSLVPKFKRLYVLNSSAPYRR